MIAILMALVLLVPVNVAGQEPREVAELRALASAAPDSALVKRVQRRSDEAREAVRELLRESVADTSESTQATSLAAARRLAGAIAVAWRDSFQVRRVARFQSLSPAQRQATVEADSLWRVGRVALRAQSVDSAMRIMRESLRRFEALADSSGIAASLSGLGVGFHRAQEYDSAVAYLTRAGDYAERIGDLALAGSALANRGNASWRQGDLPGARELFTRALQIFRRIGDATGVRSTYNSFGLVAWSGGDLAGARTAFDSGLALSRTAGDTARIELFLSNLGGVTAEQGDYAKAIAFLQEAVSIDRARENWLEAAGTLRNLGVVLQRRGDLVGSISALTEALGLMRRIGSGAVLYQLDEIDVRTVLAITRSLMGDLQGARRELARAEVVARRVGTQHRASLVELALARGNLELKFNRLAEAERQYLLAQRLARGESAEQKRSQAQIGLATVLFQRGSYRRAQTTLQPVLAMRALDTHLMATMRLLYGEAARRAGDTATARRAFRQVLDTVRALGALADEANALGRLGALEAEAERWFAAESLYRHGLTRLGSQQFPHIAWELHAGLAASLRTRGALAAATRELLAGIEQIERVSGGLELEEQRSAFRADKWDVYVDLALLEHARGRTVSAFEVSERLRGQQMLDLLARGPVGERGPLGPLATREQDLRRRIGALSGQAGDTLPAEIALGPVLRDPAANEDASSLATQELAHLQAEYGELLGEIRSTNPSYAALVRGEIAPTRAVMAALAPDEALLEYLVGDSTTLVFVVTADSLAALDLKLSHDALTAQVDFARSTLASPKEGAARRAWRAPLRRLYGQLVEPVERSGLLAGKRRLVIAPHAELHYLPFSALVRPGPPEQLLIEQYLIQYVPSASVWLKLRDRSRAKQNGGILALAPRAQALPGSRSEVIAIRRIYGDRTETLVGTPATERAFRERAPEQEIVHLATYGVLNKHNPLFSYVELSKSPDEDGRLEVHEVFGLTLNARLLVLSACQTGLAAGALGDVPPGDDWVGLVQGFLYAGAGNVVATLWPVADVATARLMERFYRELAAGRSEAEALALAQRVAVREPDTAHPFYWAGFTLVRGQ
jgi:CHAT domain-containing protein/tetratricopeptide (TPR) repeat protein